MVDAYQSGVFSSAINWLIGLATGELALVIATIAVAVVGLLMLDGRLDWRRGARVILGCFLIFGAGTISSALMALGSGVPVSSDRSPSVTSRSDIQPNRSDDPWASAFLSPEAP